MTLEDEIAVYELRKPVWLSQNLRDKFVLIYNGHAEGFFDSREQGLTEGYKRFGNVPFLVREILDHQPVWRV